MQELFTLPQLTHFEPWEAAAFFTFFGFGAVLFIRVFVEGDLYWLPYSSFWLGQSFGLPLFALFASHGLQGYKRTFWYTHWWISIGLIILGWLLGVRNSRQTEKNLGRSIWTPSEVYQWLVSFPLFTMLVIGNGAILFFASDASDRDIIGALIGLGIWVACVIVDILRDGRRNS